MSLRSRLNIESKGMFATSAFYAVAGIIFFVLLFTAGFAPQLGMIGIFSLVTAYGVLRKRTWVIWFVMILFFVGTTFSAFMIYSIFTADYFLGIGALAYLILTWVFTAYAITRRKAFES